MLSDMRHAWQGLRRSGGHFVTAVACLSIGLAICVAAFSAINAFLSGDLPGIASRKTLVLAFAYYDDAGAGKSVSPSRHRLSLSDFDIFRNHHGSAFRAVAAEGRSSLRERQEHLVRPMGGAFVSGHYFDVLGTKAARGRLLSPADDEPSASPSAVIGYDYWMLLMGGRDDIVGMPIVLEKRTFTIVGVAPKRFTGMMIGEPGRRWMDETQFWVPLHYAAEFPGTPAQDSAWLYVAGRLAGNRRLSAAQGSADSIAAAIEGAQPAARRHTSMFFMGHGVDPLENPAVAFGSVALFMLLPMVVLAVACANVANLQLARATERTPELTIRAALGASRLQVIRPLTIEAALVTATATIVAWAGAAYGLHVADSLSPVPLRLDMTVLLFSTFLMAAVIFLSGCVPAWIIARRCAATALRHTGQSGARGPARLRNGLVALQVALSVVLIFVTAVALRSLSVLTASMSSHAGDVEIVRLNVPDIGASPTRLRQIVETAVERLSADPRVSAAAAADVFSGRGVRYWLTNDDPEVLRLATGGVVTPSWFGVVGARAIAGRSLTAADANARVVVVSSELAELVAPDAATAIGRRLKMQNADGGIDTVEIAGVVINPLRSPYGMTPPALYLPLGFGAPNGISLFFRARARGPVLAGLRRLLLTIDPRLAWTSAYTLETLMEMQGVPMRYLAFAFGGMGLLALVLAVAGLYAVMAYVVSLRTSEIGIRMALGARPRDVIAMVIRQAVRLVLSGTVAGLVVAVPLTFLMRSMIVSIRPADPWAFCQTTALFLVAAVAAAAFPARRAAAIEPVAAIREE